MSCVGAGARRTMRSHCQQACFSHRERMIWKALRTSCSAASSPRYNNALPQYRPQVSAGNSRFVSRRSPSPMGQKSFTWLSLRSQMIKSGLHFGCQTIAAVSHVGDIGYQLDSGLSFKLLYQHRQQRCWRLISRLSLSIKRYWESLRDICFRR